jgi:hypothetical protein
MGLWAYRDLEHKLAFILLRLQGIENGWQAVCALEFDVDDCLRVRVESVNEAAKPGRESTTYQLQ